MASLTKAAFGQLASKFRGGNGQGETSEDCLENLASAVKLILDINREEAHAIDPHAQELDLCVA